MKRSAILPLASALLLSALWVSRDAGRAHAAWGQTKVEDRVALLWVPDMNTVDWEAFQGMLTSYPDAALTIAVSPHEIPEEVLPWLTPWVKEGRVEAALRITGDPILPLIHSYRRSDVIDRIALGRNEYKQIFGEYPEGFVPGDGALSPELAKSLEKQHFRWAAVGDAVFGTPWFSGDKDPVVLIPFQIPTSTQPSTFVPEAGAKSIVLSELNGTIAPGTGAQALTAILEKTRNDRWTSVTQALQYMRPYAVGPEQWPPWSGDLGVWTDHPLQEKAWQLYALTAEALSRYQNSGSASLSTLNSANLSFFRAQNSRYYRVDHLKSSVMEQRLRNHLLKVFKTMKKKPPRALYVPIKFETSAVTAQERDAESPESESLSPPVHPDKGGLEIGIEGDSLFIRNPEGSSASLPPILPALPPGTTAQDFWTPRALDIAWNEKEVTLKISMAGLLTDNAAPNGFNGLMAEIYLDLNNLAGRGATALLPKRQGFLRSMDAWEYAVVATGWDAGLYRSLPGQPPAFIEHLETKTYPAAREIRVSIPRRRLRGNPAGWGYLFLTLATNPGRAKQNPPMPLTGKDESPILGVLASLEDQKKLFESKSSYRRLSAVRLDERR